MEVEKNGLILIAHQDDEICASDAIGRLDRVNVGLFTDGEHGEDDRTSRIIPPGVMAGVRRDEFRAVAELMGFESAFFLRQPDGGVNFSWDFALSLAGKLRDLKPGVLILPSYDLREHNDHRRVYELGKVAAEIATLSVKIDELGESYKVPLVLEMEMMHMSNRFDCLVAIQNPDLVRRHQLTYESQFGPRMEKYFTARYAFRGNQLGVAAAEAFRVVNGQDPNFVDSRVMQALERLPLRYHPQSFECEVYSRSQQLTRRTA